METAIKRNKKPVRCRPSRATLTCKFFARLLFFCLFFFAFFKGKQQRKKSETKRKYVKGPFRSRSIAALGGSVAQLIMERGSTGVRRGSAGGPPGPIGRRLFFCCDGERSVADLITDWGSMGVHGGPPGVRRAQSVGVFFFVATESALSPTSSRNGGPWGSTGVRRGSAGPNRWAFVFFFWC